MASLGPEAGDFPAMTVALTRAAGPDGGYEIALEGLEETTPTPQAIVIDGQRFAGGRGSADGRRPGEATFPVGPLPHPGRNRPGGMATVYAGERDDREFERKVAVKILRRGMDTADIVRRLRRERQILASLDHPNIARLLDGGSTADGRPFVVMEHIEGEPIDVYCEKRGLDLAARSAALSADLRRGAFCASQPDPAPRHQNEQYPGDRRRYS